MTEHERNKMLLIALTIPWKMSNGDDIEEAFLQSYVEAESLDPEEICQQVDLLMYDIRNRARNRMQAEKARKIYEDNEKKRHNDVKKERYRSIHIMKGVIEGFSSDNEYGSAMTKPDAELILVSLVRDFDRD